MCWSEEVSLLTFTIGTLVNILVAYAIPDPTIIAITFIWEIVLLVQLYEAIGWHSIKEGNSSNGAANVLAIAVMLQPIIVAFALLAVSDAGMNSKYLAALIAFLYAGWCLYVLLHTEKFQMKENCSHVDYYWWDSFPGHSFPYLIALFALLLLLIRPIDLAIFVSLFLAITLGLSAIFYRQNIGSIWCWFGAFGMAFVALYWYTREKIVN